VFLGYLIGSNGMQPEAVTPPPSPASGFSVSNLSIQPVEVPPNEIVTITVSIANTHDTWGIYSLVLKINGVKEAEKQATVDAGSSQDVSFSVTREDLGDVSFSVTREDLGSYTVFINGVSGGFTVVAPAQEEEVQLSRPTKNLNR
jgi:hypothetical protein